MNISKNMNFLTMEISENKLPEGMIKELKDNNIIHDKNIIHFRISNDSKAPNPLVLFPKAIMIMGKY